MNRPNTTAKIAILKALEEIGRPAGAARIQERLLTTGSRLQQRTVRFYLLELDREGLTRCVSRRAGRELTEQGRHELECANIIQKVGFIASRIDSLVYRMTYDPRVGAGTIVSNLALIPKDGLVRALEIMRPVFLHRLGMGTRLAIIEEGETLGATTVPRGQIALGTVCSVTANGILLKQGIPVVSRFGGLIEIQDRRPVRFVAVIEYSGTTLDPLEAFIRAGMTQVRECVRTDSGVIGVSFREVPAAAVAAVRRIKEEMNHQGLDGILAIGTPNQPLFDIPVAEGRAGLIVSGGLNPIAALCEARMEVTFHSLAEVEDIAQFADFNARCQQFC
ncbi:MAG: NrpR regulatory domain-containing protein [Verrucomicrobiia bacterium]